MSAAEIVKILFIFWVLTFIIWEIFEKVIAEKKYPVGSFKTFYRFIGANLFAAFICGEGGILFASIIFSACNIICLGCVIAKNQALIYNQLVKNAPKEIEKETENVIATEK